MLFVFFDLTDVRRVDEDDGEIPRLGSLRLQAAQVGFDPLALHRRAGLADDRAARQLIHERERSLKRSLARLDHRRPLENWGGASSIGRLDYRWQNVRQLLWDIQRGTRRHDEDTDA